MTTLARAASINDATLLVDAPAPHQHPFLATIGDERVLVTSGSGTTSWSVLRGQDASGPSSHAEGATLEPTEAAPAGAPNGWFNVTDYGAAGDGMVDDTAAIQAAIDAAQAVNGVCYLPEGTYLISSALAVGTAPFMFLGAGPGSILKASAAIATGVIAAVGTLNATFADFAIDGNALAVNGLRLTIAVETSTRNVIRSVRITGCSSYQFYNQGHEDTVLRDCYTPGYPALGTYIAVPSGMAWIEGGALFGQITLDEYQQISISGCALGPIRINNSGAAKNRTLALTGCYVYDDTDYRCIDTSTNLTNVTLEGCYLVAQTWDAWINGNLPVGVAVRVGSTVFAQAAGNEATTTYLTQTSDAGLVVLDGCSTALNGGASATAWRTVGGTAGYCEIRSRIFGVTPPSRALATPAVPATTVNYTNDFPTAAHVHLTGGTVTVVKIDGVATGQTSGHFYLPQGAVIQLTYSAGPSWLWWGD